MPRKSLDALGTAHAPRVGQGFRPQAVPLLPRIKRDRLAPGRAAGGILQTRSRRQPFDRIYEWQPEQVHGQVDGTAAALLCPRVVPLRPGRQ